MSALLEKLGVPKNVRLFFRPSYRVLPDGSLQFPFGGQHEHFSSNFHRVPVTAYPWTAGHGPLHFIAFSAMECIAYLSINAHRYHDYSVLQFTATGITPQVPRLNTGFKTCLLTGSDLLGRLNAIRFAASLRNKHIAIRYLSKEKYLFCHNGRKIILREPLVSLSAVEKGLGIRTGIRTAAPGHYHTFLEQLKHNPSWY